jgi:hypothetical protein
MRRRNAILDRYLSAKEVVANAGYSSEIDWQSDVCVSEVAESDFLREAAWVVLSCGMRESVVRSKFPAITEAFCSWESAHRIVRNADRCRKKALSAFSHCGKIDAIISIARRVQSTGYGVFRSCVEKQGIEFIRTLPFMGPVTSFHLAKNIGLNVAKPDRHLVRVATAAGYESPAALCEDISRFVGDSVPVVDIVIWRFATLNPQYEDFFSIPTSGA